jgi:osmotically inducible lipoprotein OsmB
MRHMKAAGAALGLAAMVMGCAQMSPTEQRTLKGGAIGTAGGAIIGAMAGNAGLGAAAGAGAGLLGGYLYDRYQQSRE